MLTFKEFLNESVIQGIWHGSQMYPGGGWHGAMLGLAKERDERYRQRDEDERRRKNDEDRKKRNDEFNAKRNTPFPKRPHNINPDFNKTPEKNIKLKTRDKKGKQEVMKQIFKDKGIK